jgi:hypothetical protein
MLFKNKIGKCSKGLRRPYTRFVIAILFLHKAGKNETAQLQEIPMFSVHFTTAHGDLKLLTTDNQVVDFW